MPGSLISPSIPKSWQEMVELALRAVCVALCFIIMICAAVALSAIENVNSAFEDIRQDYRDSDDYEAAAGWLVFVAVIGMAIESAIIIVRILNVSLVKQNFLIFVIADIVISGAFALFLLAGGSANAAYSSDNRDLNDDIERECENPGSRTFEDICDNLPRVRDSEAAAAAFSFFGMVAFIGLAGIMIFNLVFKNRTSSPSADSAPSA